MPRFVLAGNNLAAVFVLELLLEACAADELLVIAPPAGERAEWQESLELRAHAKGVECFIPDDVNEPAVARHIAAHEPDLFLSVYYTQIFRGELMDLMAGKALNFHPSLLPLHRGTAPLIWAIIDGDDSCGLSIHHVSEEVDMGNLVDQRSLPIHRNDTGFTLHLKMANLVRGAASEILRGFLAGEPIPTGREQTGRSTRHSSRDPRVNHLEWSQPRGRIRDIVRAIAPPLPGAFVLLDEQRITISRVEPVETSSGSPRTPGMVEVGRDGSAIVWAKDGALRLVSAVVEGSVRQGSELVEFGLLHEGLVLD